MMYAASDERMKCIRNLQQQIKDRVDLDNEDAAREPGEWSGSPEEKYANLMVSVGEIAGVIVEEADAYGPGSHTVGNARISNRLIYTAAVILSWLEAIDYAARPPGDDRRPGGAAVDADPASLEMPAEVPDPASWSLTDDPGELGTKY